MIAMDVGIDPERPKSIFERLSIPVVSELLSELKNADPLLAGVVVDLYDFSSAALDRMSNTILQLREEVRATGKAIKAFSVPTSTGGFTYAVVTHFSEASRRSAQAIGRKHKYDTRSDRWYVIVDSIETTSTIDGSLPLSFHGRQTQTRRRTQPRSHRTFIPGKSRQSLTGARRLKQKTSPKQKTSFAKLASA